MSYNPYSPPATSVADFEDAGPLERPAVIKKAVILLWLSVGLGLATVIMDWQEVAARWSVPLVLGVQTVTVAINAWLIWKIWMCRNWARVTTLVLIAISLPYVFRELMDTAARAPASAGLGLMHLGSEVGTLYLLIFPGRDWFRRRASNP